MEKKHIARLTEEERNTLRDVIKWLNATSGMRFATRYGVIRELSRTFRLTEATPKTDCLLGMAS